MATTISNDVTRFLLAGMDKFFAENWDSWPTEYSEWNRVEGFDKIVSYLNNMGNLKAAEEIGEDNPVAYSVLAETVQTALTLKQYGIGLSFSMLAEKGDQYGMVNKARMTEVLRSLKTKLEQISIKPWDDAFSVVQADGVAMCSAAKPCLDSGATYLTLATGALDAAGTGAANVQTAIRYMAQQKNAQGDPFPAIADTLKTHAANQMSVEALFGSALVPFSTATNQTKNPIPRLTAKYSHYLAGTDNWFIEDSRVPHVYSGYSNNMATPVADSRRNPYTKAIENDIVYLFGAASVPNPGVVGSSGA